MFVCRNPECGRMWSAWLAACATCHGQLRRFGDDPSDFDRPEVARFPVRQAHEAQRFGIPAATGGMAGGGLGAPPRPDARSTVAEWRTWAIYAGVPSSRVEGATKAQLRDLVAATGPNPGADPGGHDEGDA